jgi:hypothetical protein
MLKRVIGLLFRRGMEWEDGLAITEQIGAFICVSGELSRPKSWSV